MTRKIGNMVIIQATEPDVCDRCGKIDELRPYGKDGEDVCFDCCTKEEKEAAMTKLFGPLPARN